MLRSSTYIMMLAYLPFIEIVASFAVTFSLGGKTGSMFANKKLFNMLNVDKPLFTYSKHF